MGFRGISCRAAFALGILSATAVPALTQAAKPTATRLSVFSQLQPGLWQLRDLDHGNARAQSVCLGDPNAFIQLRHRNTPCSRLVIANDRAGATVHYTCPAGGYGRTSLRLETPRLAMIDTQGIAGNAPFAMRMQARRVGNCKR